MSEVKLAADCGFVKTNRKAWNQHQFDEYYEYQPEPSMTCAQRIRQLCPMPSGGILHVLSGFIPITRWLPKYKLSYLSNDAIAGLTVGVMSVPQGKVLIKTNQNNLSAMAYANLAGVAPVYGLYTSFFAPLFYMIFGTSRHISLGTFAVVSLMVNNVRLGFESNSMTTLSSSNSTTNTIITTTTPLSSIDKLNNEVDSILIVNTIGFSIGLVLLIMAILRLSFLTSYLSDQVIGGFTTGAAFHVFSSQLGPLIDVDVARYEGGFKLFYALKDIAEKLPTTNVATLITSFVCIAFLIVGKDYLNPFIQKKLPAPIPFDLIAVIVATVISYEFSFHNKYHMPIVSTIPTGMPPPHLPKFELIPRMLADSASIAIVIYVITISAGKLFAKKHGYRVVPAQELRALCIVELAASTVSCLPPSGSLTRAAINSQVGVKTALSNMFSAGLILVMILWLGPLLEHLPKCILASIIVVALKPMLMQLQELRKLWPISKIDFSIWLIAFLGTVLWDVAQGLGIGVAFALLTIIFRSQWPKSVQLGRIPLSDLYRDVNRYRQCGTFDKLRIFRFDSPLLFTNIEAFKRRARELVQQEKTSDDADSSNNPALIIDASGFTYIDCMGINALKELYEEMNKERKVQVYFAACKAPVRDMLEHTGFYKSVPKSQFYPSIHDAVVCALLNNVES